MNSITIIIDLPPRMLSPNARCHWAVKAKHVSRYRRHAHAASLVALFNAKESRPCWEKAKLNAKAFFKTKAFPDPSNFMASLKAAEDGIADAGIIVNDRALWPERPVFDKDAKRPRIEITITRE
jgi:crossover junction endodeoxyribonuclease RusA